MSGVREALQREARIEERDAATEARVRKEVAMATECITCGSTDDVKEDGEGHDALPLCKECREERRKERVEAAWAECDASLRSRMNKGL